MPIVDGELSVRKFSNKSPPLPELTVMCGGRRGAKEPSEAIVLVKGGSTNYIQEVARINRPLRLMFFAVSWRRLKCGGSRDRRNQVVDRKRSEYAVYGVLEGLFIRLRVPLLYEDGCRGGSV